MGVKQCDRRNCDNILCDICIDFNNKQYYLCGECANEFSARQVRPLAEQDVKFAFSVFVTIDKELAKQYVQQQQETYLTGEQFLSAYRLR